MNKQTREEIVELIKNTDGKIFTVTFVKRTTGEIRVMNCRLGVTKHLKGGTQSYDPSEYDLLTVFDMQKKAYRSISLDTIISVKISNTSYVTE